MDEHRRNEFLGVGGFIVGVVALVGAALALSPRKVLALVAVLVAAIMAAISLGLVLQMSFVAGVPTQRRRLVTQVCGFAIACSLVSFVVLLLPEPATDSVHAPLSTTPTVQTLTPSAPTSTPTPSVESQAINAQTSADFLNHAVTVSVGAITFETGPYIIDYLTINVQPGTSCAFPKVREGYQYVWGTTQARYRVLVENVGLLSARISVAPSSLPLSSCPRR